VAGSIREAADREKGAIVAVAPADIDEYLDSISPPARDVVSRLRGRIHELVPGAQETISYQNPTFTLDGRRFVHLAGWKSHLSLYTRPYDPSLDAELEPYESGRGTLKFLLDRPIPWELLDRVVLALAERFAGAE
jgi:uncharacterized protein YdhG (YjbR/CyaY superfamily)